MRKSLIALAAVPVAILAAGCASTTSTSSPSASAPAPAQTTAAAPAPTTAAPAPTKAAAATIEEGTWTVGTDIPAGTYKLESNIAPDTMCYWSITKSGSNGTDIISNGIPTGGRPSVTIKAGQDFTNQGCGVFVKTG